MRKKSPTKYIKSKQNLKKPKLVWSNNQRRQDKTKCKCLVNYNNFKGQKVKTLSNPTTRS